MCRVSYLLVAGLLDLGAALVLPFLADEGLLSCGFRAYVHIYGYVYMRMFMGMCAQCMYVWVYASICVYVVCVYVHFFCLSFCPSVRLSVCTSVESVCLFSRLSVCRCMYVCMEMRGLYFALLYF